MKEYFKGLAYLGAVILIAVCIVSIDSVIIVAHSLTFNDVMIAAIGVILWILVALETIDLMLPSSDEPYDWQ